MSRPHPCFLQIVRLKLGLLHRAHMGLMGQHTACRRLAIASVHRPARPATTSVHRQDCSQRAAKPNGLRRRPNIYGNPKIANCPKSSCSVLDNRPGKPRSWRPMVWRSVHRQDCSQRAAKPNELLTQSQIFKGCSRLLITVGVIARWEPAGHPPAWHCAALILCAIARAHFGRILGLWWSFLQHAVRCGYRNPIGLAAPYAWNIDLS